MNRIERATQLANEQRERLNEFKKVTEPYLGTTEAFFQQPYEVDQSFTIMNHLVLASKGNVEFP